MDYSNKIRIGRISAIQIDVQEGRCKGITQQPWRDQVGAILQVVELVVTLAFGNRGGSSWHRSLQVDDYADETLSIRGVLGNPAADGIGGDRVDWIGEPWIKSDPVTDRGAEPGSVQSGMVRTGGIAPVILSGIEGGLGAINRQGGRRAK